MIDGGVRLIFEGLTSRPGIRRGSLSRSGRGRRCRLPIVGSRASRDGVGLPGCSCAPRQRPGRGRGGCGQSRVAASQRNAASSRATAIATTPAGLRRCVAEVLPALVQASLGAPGDLDDARVLAVLAAGERLADRGAGSGSGGRPRPAAGARGPGPALVIDPGGAWCRMCARTGRSRGTRTAAWAWGSARSRRPRRESRRRRACRCRGSSAAGRSPGRASCSGIACSSASISVPRRPTSISTAAR